MASGQDAGAGYDLWDGAGIEGGFLTDELGALGDAADYGLPQFTPDLYSLFQLEAGAAAGSGGQAPVDPSPGPANPTEPAEGAAAELAADPADKQKREYVRWAPEEEAQFYDVLKTVLGQKPERCFLEVSKVIQTKDFSQARAQPGCGSRATPPGWGPRPRKLLTAWRSRPRAPCRSASTTTASSSGSTRS